MGNETEQNLKKETKLTRIKHTILPQLAVILVRRGRALTGFEVRLSNNVREVGDWGLALELGMISRMDFCRRAS